jgi:hypothetical protein
MRGMNTLPPASNTNESYNPFAPDASQTPTGTENPFLSNPFQAAPSRADDPFAFGRSVVDYRPATVDTNPFSAVETAGRNDFSTLKSPFAQSSTEWVPSDYQSSRLGERLREKARPVMELGRRAVSAIVQLAPRMTDRLKTAYNSDYGQKVTGIAREAASETATAAALGGVQALGERFGVGYENGELTVRKAKLARGAIRFALNPYGESVKAAKIAGREAYKAGKHEARGHAYAAGATFANDTFGYLHGRVS